MRNVVMMEARARKTNAKHGFTLTHERAHVDMDAHAQHTHTHTTTASFHMHTPPPAHLCISESTFAC